MDKTYPAATAAHAADLPPRTLRAAVDWLRILSDGTRHFSGWRRFEPVDIVRLAVLGRLVEHKFTVPQAVNIIEATVDRKLGAIVTSGIDIDPSYICSVALHDVYVRVERGPLGITATMHPHHATRPGALVLDICALASAALARLVTPVDSFLGGAESTGTSFRQPRAARPSLEGRTGCHGLAGGTPTRVRALTDPNPTVA